MVKRFKLKPRLFLSVGMAAIALMLLPDSKSAIARILCASDLGMLGFLALTWGVMLRSQPESMRAYARSEDEGR